jgi:tRNA threonylcarbamoyladenosine biosynthesis protein TsaB
VVLPDSPIPPILYVDAASPVVAVGLQTDPAPESAIWRHVKAEADVAMFQAAEELLRKSALTVADLRTIVFCEGPGSLLGIRLAAMMIRTWSILPREHPLSVFGYRSLPLLAADLLDSSKAPPFRIITDARRQSWNVLPISATGEVGEIARVRTTELHADEGAVFYPQEFRSWQPMPNWAQAGSYRPETIATFGAMSGLLHPVESPDAFMTEMPTYKTWEPNQTSSGSSHG